MMKPSGWVTDRVHRGLAAVVLSFIFLSALAAGPRILGYAAANFIPPIEHDSVIFILSNGSISPSAVPIQRNGDTYTFTGRVNGGIAVQRNGVTINGAGFSLTGSDSGTGFLIKNTNNVTVRDVKVQNFSRGFFLTGSSGNVIRNNVLAGCGVVVTGYSNFNEVVGNTISAAGIEMSGGNDNFAVNNTAAGISLIFSNKTIVLNNKISLEKRVDVGLISTAEGGGLFINNSNNCTLVNNAIENETVGVHIWYSINLIFSGNTLRGNQIGFKIDGPDLAHNIFNIDTTNKVNGKPVYYLVNKQDYTVPTNAGWIAAVNSTNVTVTNWFSPPNWDAIYFVNTTNSVIANNNLTGNFNAIRLIDSINITIHGNIINNNGYAAIYLDGATSCTVTENDVANNLCIFNIRNGAKNNIFFHNNFSGNWTGSLDRDFPNVWDKGAEGNYWSNYTGTDMNGDGIGDTPFLVDSSGYSKETDNYPLVTPLKLSAGTHAEAKPESDPSVLSMPEEYLNYTIVKENGTLWAKIDGLYPMRFDSQDGTVTLPMIYPTPPNTTNMHVYLDRIEQNWTQYEEIDPFTLHHTDIGDWQMIYCPVKPAADEFVLQIHYEHPVQVINGTYVFLYDLNIGPYLSMTNPQSTAHFRVQLDANCSDVKVYTTGYSGTWKPAIYSRPENVVTFDIVSTYDSLLGDIVVTLGTVEVPELPIWAILLVSFLCMVGVIAYQKKRFSKPE